MPKLFRAIPVFLFALSNGASDCAAAKESATSSFAWTVSSPEAEGMDSSLLQEASNFIERNCPARFSLLVVRNGKLVFERYFNGCRAADTNNIKSMSKSILSVLTGIALDEGLLRGVDQKLCEFFPEYFHPDGDARKREITLGHILTMTAGFAWAENTANSDLLYRSMDWHRHTIELPLSSAPGAVFNYDTGLTHLLSGILTRASGMSTLAYATSRLFAPLGISPSRWSQDPRGYFFGGSEVWMTARDLARFGLLALRDGRWQGRQIVPEEWMRESRRLRVRTNSAGWGFGDYAYLWWKKDIAGYPVTLASGYGGQNIFLVPELDLLVVTTARSDVEPPYSYYMHPYDIMSRYVIPAVKADPPKLEAVANAADGGPQLAPNAFALATGSGFTPVERDWEPDMPADGRLPANIGGVQVRIGNRTCHPSRVRGDRVEFLVPPDVPAGRYSVEIITPKGRAAAGAEVAEFAPALFTTARDGGRFAAERAAVPGEVVELRASGLGPSSPRAPAGAAITGPLPPANPPEVRVGGRRADVIYAALVSAGVWRLDVRIPEGAQAGVARVELMAGGVESRGEAVLEIRDGNELE